MPLSTMKDILKCADDNGFAAAAFDVYNFESANWVVKAAEELNIPVILMFYPDMRNFIPLKIIGNICRMIAESSSVPVGMHLDHSRSFELVVSGIPSGFQSIMFDGSARPFDENAGITKQVVESAGIFGVDVEAELGLVGMGSKKEDFLDTELYTRSEDAKKFVEITGVDALAVAIGNSHGHYVCEPHLDIARLDEINRTIDTPLVLHGGSGIPREQMVESVKHGINKVNIGTEFFAKCRESVGRNMSQGSGSVTNSLQDAGEEVMELVRDRLTLLNPNGFKLA